MSNASQTYGGVAQLRTDAFTNTLRVMLEDAAAQVERVNRDNGWFDADRTVLEGHMLLVTEVAEMSEAWRVTGLNDATELTPHLYSDNGPHCQRCGANKDDVHRTGDFICGIPKPEGYGSECADVLIRLLDQCTRDGVDLAGEFTRKLEYNRTRGRYHGGKKL